MKRLVFASIISLFANVSFAQVVQISENTLPRGVESATSITINVTVTDISEEVFNSTSEWAETIDLYLKKSAFDYPVPKDGEVDENDVGFQLEGRTLIEEGTNDKNLRFVVISVPLVTGDKDFSQIVETDDNGTFIEMQATFKRGDDDAISSTETKIYESISVAAAAPTGFTLAGAFKGIAARWDDLTSITFDKGGDETETKTPSAVVVVTFDASANGALLPTYKFLPDADADEEGELCQIDLDQVGTGNSCVVCDDADGVDKIYLNTSTLLSSTTVNAVRTSNTSTSIGNLDVGQTYYAFAYYEPAGIVRTECFEAVPTENVTWSELNGEVPPAEATDPKCFIATAAYGSVLHERLDSLRWFRDEVLRESELGENFVAFYYVTAPLIADLIAEHSTLKEVTRLALAPITAFTEASQKYGLTRTIAIVFCLMLLMWGTFRLTWLRLRGTI